MGANDTSYTITLGSRSGGAEDANTANTVYELRLNSSSSSALGNRTGLGNITVSNDIPPFLGIPIERSLYCRLPTANGGSNILKAVVDADDNNIVEIFRGGRSRGSNSEIRCSWNCYIRRSGRFSNLFYRKPFQFFAQFLQVLSQLLAQVLWS